MGKTRTKRGRAARADPTGRQENGAAAGDDVDAEAAGDASRGDSIANVVEQVREDA